MSLKRYKKLTEKAEADPEYWKDIAVSDFARELTLLMGKRRIQNAELARRMGVQRQYVTKLLGGTNATLGSMAKIALALNAVVRLRLETFEERDAEQAGASAENRIVINLADRRPAPDSIASSSRASTNDETHTIALNWKG